MHGPGRHIGASPEVRRLGEAEETGLLAGDGYHFFGTLLMASFDGSVRWTGKTS